MKFKKKKRSTLKEEEVRGVTSHVELIFSRYLYRTQQEINDIILLSQQIAHTHCVLLVWIWSQRIRTASHMVLFLGEKQIFTNQIFNYLL